MTEQKLLRETANFRLVTEMTELEHDPAPVLRYCIYNIETNVLEVMTNLYVGAQDALDDLQEQYDEWSSGTKRETPDKIVKILQ
jgi:hypothetical protein